MREISVAELAEWLEDTQRTQPYLLDVREEWEFQTCHLAKSVLIPMATIPNRLNDIPDEVPLVVICHHGVRSYQVAAFLAHAGFENVASVAGGVAAWADIVDPSMAKY